MVFNKKTRRKKKNNRLNIVLAIIFLFNFLILLKLFNLQVINGNFFVEASSDQHDIYKKITPKRGRIFLEDKFSDELYPVAVNHELALVYADPAIIDNYLELTKKLSEILKPLWIEEKKQENKKAKKQDDDKHDDDDYDDDYSEEEMEEFLESKIKDLKEKLADKKSRYKVIAKQVSKENLDEILALKERGIGYVNENFRYYPESSMLSQISGFVGHSDEGQKGRYGVEGYFDEILRGKPGSVCGKKDALGYFLSTNNSKITSAESGSDLVLTIDRSIQFKACEELRKSVEAHDADSGMVVIMNPVTGAIIAMCSEPNYDANYYFQEEDISVFNNPAVATQYEPGSIFKPITVAAGLDAGKISPNTTYYDAGCIKVGVEIICNSDFKSHEIQNMTNVLEESLNTGTIFILNQIGKDKFKKYVEDFGFGSLSGVDLNPESRGDIKALSKKQEIYSATASFGQGISTTPLQLVSSFGAIANGGVLMKPFIVKKIISPNNVENKTEPKEIRRVISSKTSALVSGMLASVVKKGHGKRAGVEGYYVAGKTGTAQVPKEEGGGYKEDETIGSFIGFAPVENPKFVMLVRIDNPKDVIWAESSAAPLFGRLAKFMLNYYEVEPEY
ncbi:penicillin-binding protein 2 [Candidatus Falkowbacteria bacterium]|jgi:cell division protein FtsI/penicillin-binding protein 2|nr:penicillin-binding protein 2 [Candidatus Falkowbacteria bacterium]